MILSFKDMRTERFAKGEFVRAFQSFDRHGWKRLELLEAAVTLADLVGLPSSRLEALSGDRAGATFDPHQSTMADMLRVVQVGKGSVKRRDRDYH
jgi:hypothetical protein